MMKKILFFAVLLAGAQTAVAKQVKIQTKNTTMVLNVDEGILWCQTERL